MTADDIDALDALLTETGHAHGKYEESELNGVYDEQWAKWYAAYAVEHGISELVGHAITAEQLAEFLARSFVEYEQIDPDAREPWARYTSRRITSEL